MHRRGVRMIVGGVEVDVPLGAFSAGNAAVFDGTQLKGAFRAVCASTVDQPLSGAGSSTQTALTNLSFALPGAGTYFFEFELQTATNTGSTTQDYSISYSGTVTGGIANMLFAASATSITPATTTTFTTAGTLSGTRSTITTVFPVTIRGTVTVSTAGTLQLNGATGNTADALVVKARSGGLCEQQ